jgi:hypothetical protein
VEHTDELETVDWIILGRVLCEVADIQSALNVCDRLLKKVSGRVYFRDHIAKPEGSLMRVVQMMVNPWWVRVSMGCNCNRHTLALIQGMKGLQSVVWTYDAVCAGQPWKSPVVLGLVRKA